MPVILCNCPPPMPSGTADGQVPVWDATAGAWVPGTAPDPECCPPDGTETGDTLIWGGSEWVAQQPSGGIDSGTSFPSSPSAGDVFYRTDLREIAYYDGTRWVGNPLILPMANYASFASNISASQSYVYAAAIPDFSIYVEEWEVARYIGSADASNYWTYDLRYYPTGGTYISLVTQNVTAPTGWAKTRHSIGAVVPSTSLIFLSIVTKTGSPGIFAYMTTLIVRRVYT